MNRHSDVYYSKDILFFDLETSIKNRGEEAIGNNKASPYCKDNKVVWSGWYYKDWGVGGPYTERGLGCFFEGESRAKLVVAQNISFDLSYCLREHKKDVMEWIAEGGMIWDVMLVEYLLTGQELKFASLDELATIYGGELKDDRIKEYWENGIDTEDIPEEEIIPYLKGDVSNLIVIYEGQLKEAERLGMLPLIESQMEARLATIIMEHNGMCFDKELAMSETVKLIAWRDEIEQEIKQDILAMDITYELREDEVNPASNQQLSAFIFGGFIKVVRDLPALDSEGNEVVYKTGKRKGEVKTKKTPVNIHLRGFATPEHEASASGYYSVGDDIIEGLINNGSIIAQRIKDYRELSKQINTYFTGYSGLVWPDGLIHGSINHCATNTGRLSSSNPNLQNISNKESKEK